MATLDQLRSLFPDAASDADVIRRASDEFGISPTEIANEVGYATPKGGLTKSQFSSSIDRYQAGLYGLAEEAAKGLGADSAGKWLQGRREENELQADLASNRARSLGAVDSWKDVNSLSDFGSYAKNLGIQSLPYAAEALAGGLLTRGAMSGTRAALTAAEAAKDTAAIAKAKRALDVGSTAGGTVASYPSAVGDILSNQREQADGKTDLGAAALLGVPYAIANATLGVDSALAKGSLFRNSVDLLDSVKGVKGGVARAAATGAVTGVKEGASETFQEVTNQLGRMAVDPNASLTSPDALDRYKESFIGGAVLGGGASTALGGWRKSGNDIEQAFQSTSTGTTPANTVEQPVPPVAPPSAPAAAVVPPAAPVVQGGTTDVAQASQAAQNEQAQADIKLQEQAGREQAFQTVGATLTPDNGGELTVFGQKVFGPQIATFGNALAGKINALPEHGTQIANAIAQAHTETGNKLVSFQYNGGNPVGSADKLVKAITKVADKFQIAHVESVDQAADILNKQSETAKGDKLEQINAIHVALTGQDTTGFLQATNQPAKGAQDGQLQVQTPAGVGSVPAQGSAAPATDDVGSSGLRAVGASPDGQAAPNVQADPGTAGLLRLDAPAAPGGGSGTAAGQASQVTGAVDGQQAPAPQAAGAGQAAPQAGSTAQVTGDGQPDAGAQGVSQGSAAEEVIAQSEAALDVVPQLLRNILGMVFRSPAKVEFLATFMRKQSDVTYAELGQRLGLSENTIKDYQKMLRVGSYQTDPKTGKKKFVESKAGTFQVVLDNQEKFTAALAFQSEKLGVDPEQLFAALNDVADGYSSANPYAGVADEGDLINQGYAIQNLKERTDSSGKGTGKVDRTNVSDLNEEGNKAEALNNRYLQLMDQLDEAESNGDEATAEKLRDELAAVAVLAAEADKRARAEVASKAGKTKQEKQEALTGDLTTAEKDQAAETDAPKESDTEVIEPAAAETADEEDTADAPKKPAAKKPKAKQEPKATPPQVLKSDDQRAGEAWDLVVAEYPNAPKWADLTKAQRETFVEYGEDNWTPDDVRGELVKLAKTAQTQKSAPKLGDESNVIDVEARVIDETVGPQVLALPEPQVSRLERHYNLKRDSAEFLARVKEDVVKYATKGADAVSAAIRDVIKAIHSGVLAMAMIFNPMHTTAPEAFVIVPKAETVATTQEVKAELPSEVQGMSEAGKQAYATLIPAMKGRNGDKLITIADKPSGQIFVFDANGKLIVQKKALFGAAKGDLYKGNNDLPKNRITPAGLFGLKLVDAAKGGSAAKTAGEYDFGKVFAFEDPDAVVTIMHSVWLHEKDAPQRAAALKNSNPADSRYSFGCINVDKDTYKMLLDKYQAQMDGSKLFIVPDEQTKVGDFLAGNVPYDKMARQSVTPATETVTTTRSSATQTASVDRNMPGKEEGVQQSRKAGGNETYTVGDLVDSLLDFIGRDSLGKNVLVVDELEDLRNVGEFAGMTDAEFAKFLKDNEIDASTQAFVSNATSRVYMLASNIEVGTGRGVFMHEVGGHLGVQKQLPAELFKRLADQVVAWAKKNDGSTESVLAQAAVERVVDAGQAVGPNRYNELVAYFLEEAVNSGVNPRAYENMSPGLREWLRSLWAAFKNALRKLRGVNIDKMTAEDVVNLAYGYAQLAIAGRFHGSNAKFRRFSVKYMGTGAGNQQYGWGAYFAQRRQTAEGYSVPDTNMPEDTESHLYHVDLAIRDHEWLNWGKPLSQQSALVRKIATKMGMKLTDDGGDLYNHIAEKLFEQKYGRNPNGPEARKAHRMASEFLYTLGVKGIQYRDANDSSRESDNLVVFNEKDIVRVQTESGVALSRDALETDFNWTGVQQSRAAAIDRLPPQVKGPVDRALKAMFRNAALPAMITEDVIKLAMKYMKSAGRYLQAQYSRQQARLEIEARVEKILDRFDKLDAATQKLVNEYIHDSTLQEKWGYYPGEHRVGTTLFEVDPDFKERFDAIKAANPAAAALIQDVFEHGYQMMKLKERAVDLAVDREFKAREDAAMGDADELKKIAAEKRQFKKREMAIRNLQVDKPYAYLGRHGDFIVVAKSKEFIAAEEIAKGESSSASGNSIFGDPQQALNWLQDNRSNPDHYIVQFAETQAEADKIAAELVSTGKYDVQPEDAGPKELDGSYQGGDAFLAVKRLRNMLDRQGTPETAEEAKASAALNKAIGDLYLATAAEASARKSALHRQKIAGADKNMMRNLATAGRADAHFVSAMLFNDEIVDSLEAMRGEARQNRRAGMDYYNELYARYAKGMDYKTPAPLVRSLTQLSTVYYLSTSPAFYLQQILQTGVLSLPFMAGRLGYFRSVRAINAAYKDMANLVKGLTVTEHVDFSKAPADVRVMLQTLVGMGKIDIGIDADAKARSGEHSLMDSVMRKLQGVNTRIETINRATAAIAAYRGYLQRYGADKTAEATKYAAEVVSNTHGSYDGFNTPRVMSNDFGRFFLQFKRFQIIQLSMLAKLMYNARKGMSPEERVVARRALSFIVAHMAVLGGALGIPFVSQLGQAMLSVFGDDDEPDDLEQWLRNAIDNKELADLLLRGVPSAVGLESLGKKLAMENVASILPFTDVDLSSRSGMEKVLVGLMGPTAGIGLKMADGFGQMAKGEYYKGLELMMPTGVSNLMKGARFASEGITMRNGDTVMGPEEISVLDAAFQAVGLPTDTITDRQRVQSVVAKTGQFYDGRASEIKTDYVNAFRKGDSAAMQDAREEWQRLQDARQRNGFARQPLSNLFRAPMEAGKRERNVAGGVEFTKNNRRFVERVANQ